MTQKDSTKEILIKSVFVFPNGMCAVCNQDGQQIPELQGEWNEVKRLVFEAASKQDAPIEWYGL